MEDSNSVCSEESDIIDFDNNENEPEAVPVFNPPNISVVQNGTTFNGNVACENLILGDCQINQVVNGSDIALSDDRAAGYIEEFKNACRINTEAQTREKVAKFNLEEPDEQVNPKMVVSNFYGGATAGPDQYVPDATFMVHQPRVIEGEKITINEIHDGCNYAALVADAGSGKTTLAKRYARAVSEKKIHSMRNIELVHYVSFANLDPEEKYTAFDLLFKQQLGQRLSDGARKYGNLWVQENGDKILLILDGLDQATWTLDKRVRVAYDTKARAPSLLHNVLHNGLLGGCKILVTSREHAIRHFHIDSRPDRIIALRGLTQKSINILIRKLAPLKADEIVNHLSTKSPGLKSICVNPMFLIFTVCVLTQGLEDAPDTLSGVLMRILGCFLSSENQREEEIFEVLEKLSQLALDGTSRKSVLFTERNLHAFKLTAKQVQDLMIITPERGMDARFKLMEGMFRLFFCHQSVQEALSAIEVAKQTGEEFERFLYNHLHEAHWAVVLRILLGITLNSKTARDAQLLSRASLNPLHSGLMKDWLRKTIVKSQEVSTQGLKRRRMERENIPHFRTEDLCALLYECGDTVDDIIKDKMKVLNIKKKLRADQSHAVAWVMSHCDKVEKVDLKTGNLGGSADLMSNGFKTCKSIKFQSTKWSLSVDNQSFIENQDKKYRRVEKIHLTVKDDQKEPVTVLGKMIGGSVIHTLKIEMENPKKMEPFLTKDQFEVLKDVNAKVKVLDFNRKHRAIMSSATECDSSFRLLGEVARIFKVEFLKLDNFTLNEKESVALDQGLGDHTNKVEVKTMRGLKERDINKKLGGEEEFQNVNFM